MEFQRRDLTLLRQKACSKVGDELNLEELIHRLEEYLILLHNFTDKVAVQPPVALQTNSFCTIFKNPIAWISWEVVA